MYRQKQKSPFLPKNMQIEEAKGVFQTPLMARLLEEARENTAAATVLAQERLLAWVTEPDDAKLAEASELLFFAADQGDPEACFTLATFEPALCADEAREKYRLWAERCGHQEAMQVAEWRDMEYESNQSAADDYWQADLNERSQENTKRIIELRRLVESGDPKIQLKLGEALREKLHLCIEVGVDPDSNLNDEARRWVEAAAKTLPEACHYLAIQWQHDSETEIRLLRRAAYPTASVVYPYAICHLADAYEASGDLAAAESCLRQGLGDNGKDVEFKLAMLLMNHRQSTRESVVEARKLLVETAQAQSEFAEEAPFQLALMLLRGEGGDQDFEGAREYFKQAVANNWNGNGSSSYYAKMALVLGWGESDVWEWAVEQLLRRLSLGKFAAEPDIPLSGSDFLLLTSGNSTLQEYSVMEKVVWLTKGVSLDHNRTPPHNIFGWLSSFANLAEGLFAILKYPNLMQGDLEKLLNTPRSMIENYIWGQLWLSGRFGETNYIKAKKHFLAADTLGGLLDKTALIGPNHMRSNKFRAWLSREVIKCLLRIENEQNKQIADEYRKEIEHQKDVHAQETQRAVIDENSRMLSYLTHTLNNTFATGPESARQAMRILGSELYENNREYKAINNIASMYSTFLFAQQLLKTFKLYIAEPDALRMNWDADVEGDANIAMVLAVTLRQTLSQLVFASNHQAALQRLLPYKDVGAVKAIRKAFMDEIVPLDVDTNNSHIVPDWVQDHLGLLHVSIDPTAELHFRSNSTRYTFFFSSFSELIYNALKYSDGTQPIEISWGKSGGESGGVLMFRCVNTWTEDSIQSSEGSGKGLLYLSRLAEMLGAKFEKRIDGHRFVAEIHFPETLLKGQA